MADQEQVQAEILPVAFEENLDTLFENVFTNSDRALQVFREMIDELENVIK